MTKECHREDIHKHMHDVVSIMDGGSLPVWSRCGCDDGVTKLSRLDAGVMMVRPS